MKKLVTYLTSIGVFFTSLLKAEAPKQLVIILLGPPGAGKGTHAVELSKKLNLPHISTGDLFRENLSKNTSLGMKVKNIMNEGKLVPDELVVDMLFERISKDDCKKGYILDGYPRTLEQAKILDEKLKNRAEILAINIAIDDKPLIERITGRLVCKNCGVPYHKTFLPPKKENVCDNCQGELYQRKDDTEEVVKERLTVYHKQTEPVISYYKGKDKILYEVNGFEPKENVFNNLLSIIQKVKRQTL